MYNRINNHNFLPTKGEIFYEPKTSGGYRPLTLMTCDDLIYYQAIINFLLQFYEDDFGILSNNFIYGNIPATFNSDDIILPYPDQYKKFLNRINEKEASQSYIGTSDITSFYTEIQYKKLFEILENKLKSYAVDAQIADELISALGIWYNPSGKAVNLIKGIPQSVPQSHILANIYLIELDNKLLKESDYIRYVDDFRFFGRDKFTVQRSISQLQKYLLELNLLIKDSKTGFADSDDYESPFDEFYSHINKLFNNEFALKKKNKKKLLFKKVRRHYSASIDLFDTFDFDDQFFELNKSKDDSTELKFDDMANDVSETEIVENFGTIGEFNSLNILKIINKENLKILIERALKDCLAHAFFQFELDLIFANSGITINSKRNVRMSKKEVEQNFKFAKHLYATVMPIARVYSELTSEIGYCLLNFDNNLIKDFTRYIKMVQQLEDEPSPALINIQNLLLTLLESKYSYDFIHYYSLYTLAMDKSKRNSDKIQDFARKFMVSTDENISWRVRGLAISIIFLLEGSKENLNLLITSISHLESPGISEFAKTFLASHSYELIIKKYKEDETIYGSLLKKLMQYSLYQDSYGLNFFALRVFDIKKEFLVNEKVIPERIRQYLGLTSFNCPLRTQLTINYKIQFSDTFSFRDICNNTRNSSSGDNYTHDQTYHLINSFLLNAVKHKQLKQYEAYTNSLVAVLEGLLFVLYDFLKLEILGKKIHGLQNHKDLFIDLTKDPKINSAFSNIQKIRNANPISHLRDFNTNEFNHYISDSKLNDFDKSFIKLIEEIVSLLNNPELAKVSEANKRLQTFSNISKKN